MTQNLGEDEIILIYLKKRRDWCLKKEILENTGLSRRRLRTYLGKLSLSGLIQKAPDLGGDMRQFRYKVS